MNKLIPITITISFLFSFNCYSQTWQTYDSLRSVYEEKQSYDTALVYAEKALLLVKEKVGENDTLYANMLTAIVRVNRDIGKYEKAIEYCIKEKEIRKNIHGEKHPSYANTLNNLALTYFYMGNYPAAEPLYIEAKNIWKEALGEKHPDYISSLNNLALLYQSIGNYPKAEVLSLEAKNLYKEVLGEKHPQYTTALANLAVLYYNMGNYFAAEPLFIEVKNIDKLVLGEKHSGYAYDLNNIACLYQEMGNYQMAEPLFVESKNIMKEVFGEKSNEYSTSLHNIAELYRQMGNYAAAEPLFLEAMNIRKEVLGNKHPSYANNLNNLAILYNDMGNYSAAEPLFLEAKSIYKEVLGEKHPLYAMSINNLATLYSAMEEYSLAEPLYLEAIKILKEVNGEKHNDYATSLNNLANLYNDIGNYSAAEHLLLNAISIYKEVLGERHPLYALSINNIATLYEDMGNYPEAERLYLEAKNIRKEVLGEKHPDYAISLNNLARIYKLMLNFSVAELFYLECLEIINGRINQNFAFLSEKEKELYFKTQAGKFAGFYAFSLNYKTENPEITKKVFNNVVKNKGLLLKSSTSMRTAILNSKDTSIISKYESWISLKKEISKLYSTQISKRKKNPEELEQLANNIEKDLVRGSQTFSDFEKLQNLNWESVRNNLKPNEVAIEFIRFTEGKKSDTTTYCAILVTPQSKQPEMIKLFEEKQLLEILNSSKGNSFTQVNKLYNTSTKDSLYKLIWQPLEKYLEGVKTVYYSPDGILHKISFSALGKIKNIYLCDNVNLQQVSSTGKVAMPENSVFDKNFTACIIGGVDYATDSSANSLWQFLPGTLTEAENIKNELSKKKIITTNFSGKEASELNFKNIYSKDGCNPGILHIATHGFFYPDPEQTEKEAKKEKVEEGLVAFRGGNSGFGLWQFVKNKNPLMRSGVVLAGANKVWSEPYSGTDNEGVLTAMEVAQLDMSKTKLVVLSACETGLGDIKGSEGVYGLQRAFKMAGVKFIVMSLWQVPDKETVEFMEAFYNKLLKKKEIRLAFTETQKEMRKKYDPYYWAAFVLVE